MVHEVECLHKEKIEDIASDIKDIKKLLNGNGKLGLCAKVNIVWNSILFIIVTVVGLVAHNMYGN